MTFLEQGKKAKGPKGVYLITLCLVIIATLISGFGIGVFALKYLGFAMGGNQEGANQSIALAVQLLPFAVSFLVMLIAIKYLHKQPILSMFTARDRFDWKRFFTAFGLWGVFLTLFFVISIATGAPVEFQFEAGKFFPLLLVSLILIPIQTTAEDLLFRGILFQGLGGSLKNGILAILILGAIFGWLHSGNPEVAMLGQGILVYYVTSGLFLGLLTHLDDGMELGMGYHVVNNLFGALILTNDWQAFQTDALFVDHSVPTISWEIVLTPILLQPLLIFIFFKVYKWKNVKEKFLN